MEANVYATWTAHSAPIKLPDPIRVRWYYDPADKRVCAPGRVLVGVVVERDGEYSGVITLADRWDIEIEDTPEGLLAAWEKLGMGIYVPTEVDLAVARVDRAAEQLAKAWGDLRKAIAQNAEWARE